MLSTHYKLNSTAQFGNDVEFSDNLDIDVSAMSIVFPFADGNRRDGVGDLLEIGGIDTRRHSRNPVVCWDHMKQVTLPIGLAEDPQTKAYTVILDEINQIATVKAFFYQGAEELVNKSEEYDHALFCEQLFDLMVKRFIRAGSIGYQIVDYNEIPADYSRGIPKGNHLKAVTMLEASATVMPCNPDTVRKTLSLKRVCGKTLSPMLVKSLLPYAGEKTVQLGYEAKSLSLQEVNDAFSRQGIGTLSITQDAATKKLKVMVDHSDAANARSLVSGKGWQSEVIIVEGVKSVPVPLDENLNDTSISPVKWKPGVGAVKELRKKYRKSVRMAKPANTSDWAVGMLVVARDQLFRWDGLKQILFAKPGEQLRVVDILDYEGNRIIVRNSAGDKMEASGSTVRKTKDLKSGAKSLPDEVRQKYRVTKKLRRRVKRSSPGSSMVLMHGKDIDEARKLCEGRGVKFVRVGVKGNLEKVKLTGDDESIDHVAKRYGRPNRGNLMATKSLKAHTKDVNGNPVPGSENEDQKASDATQDTPTEKYSSQVGRRVHEDLSILMGDYDSLLGPMENEKFIQFLTKLLGFFDEHMTELEGLHASEHPDAEPLSGSKDMDGDGNGDDEPGVSTKPTEDEEADVNEEAEEADSELEEESTEDEVVEGMKNVIPVNVKALRGKYGKKSSCTCGTTKCASCSKAKAMQEDPKFRKAADKPKVPGEEENQDKPGAVTDDLPESAEQTPGSEESQDEPGVVKDDVPEPAEETPGNEEFHKGLAPHEMSTAKEAHSYLGEMKGMSNFGEEERMKCYHCAKSLEKLAPTTEVEVGTKGMDEGTEFGTEAGTEMEKGLHPHRKCCSEVGQFFKRMAYEKAFGDSHRQEADHYHKSMDGVVGNAEEEIDDPEQDSQVEPGDMGEKRLNDLETSLERLYALI